MDRYFKVAKATTFLAGSSNVCLEESNIRTSGEESRLKVVLSRLKESPLLRSRKQRLSSPEVRMFASKSQPLNRDTLYAWRDTKQTSEYQLYILIELTTVHQ